MTKTMNADRPTRMACNQKCHTLGFISFIWILQKVTYNSEKSTMGSSDCNSGPATSPMGSSMGTLAKSRYPTVPIANDDGNENFLKNFTIFISRCKGSHFGAF